MSKREMSKDVELTGRKWRIKKMDALTGSYIATKLMGKLGVVLATVISGKVNNPAAIGTAVSEALTSLSKAEFIELQRDALSVVGEVTVVGTSEAVIPLHLANGAWGVEGLEDDTMTVMALAVHSLVFNLSPFFDVDALKSVMASFPNMSLLNA